MNQAILKLLEREPERREITFHSDAWREGIPSKPGWYFVETDMPPEKFKDVRGPGKNSAHYNIPERVKESLALEQFNACIPPGRRFFYIVYSGETANLRARAREHVSGHPKTACLALESYPFLCKYKWFFCFLLCEVGENSKESKLLRTVGEQLWRAKNGWPILCKK